MGSVAWSCHSYIRLSGWLLNIKLEAPRGTITGRFTTLMPGKSFFILDSYLQRRQHLINQLLHPTQLVINEKAINEEQSIDRTAR